MHMNNLTFFCSKSYHVKHNMEILCTKFNGVITGLFIRQSGGLLCALESKQR